MKKLVRTRIYVPPKRGNDKRWLDIQKLILRATTAVLNLASICLEADKKIYVDTVDVVV